VTDRTSILFKPTFRTLGGLLAPAIAVYGFIVITPIVGAFAQSLFRDRNFTFTFVGLENYRQLLGDFEFWSAFSRNMTILLLSLVVQISFAFVIAVMMHSKLIKNEGLHRVTIFFPVVLAPIVVAFIWILVYNIHWGLLNTALRSLGLENLTRQWLDDPSIVVYSITVPLMWQFLGLFVMVFLAGLSSIPEELLEAARIDGANGAQITLQIILPLLSNTWKVVLVLAISGAVKVFEQPYIMTRGGPGMSSTVLAQYAYTTSFTRVQMGYGSTIAVGMLVLSFSLIGLSRLTMSFAKRKEGDRHGQLP
jgi:raffinose/stachyose/melibiose transport system permease protein